jgi:hypothetical protein
MERSLAATNFYGVMDAILGFGHVKDERPTIE